MIYVLVCAELKDFTYLGISHVLNLPSVHATCTEFNDFKVVLYMSQNIEIQGLAGYGIEVLYRCARQCAYILYYDIRVHVRQ